MLLKVLFNWLRGCDQHVQSYIVMLLKETYFRLGVQPIDGLLISLALITLASILTGLFVSDQM